MILLSFNDKTQTSHVRVIKTAQICSLPGLFSCLYKKKYHHPLAKKKEKHFKIYKYIHNKPRFR